MARTFLIWTLVFVAALTAGLSANEIDRLATLARVWASVKYLHPVMLQKDVDWDGALVRAIPRVRAATSDEDFARAVASMLQELDDPATRVVQRTSRSRPPVDVTLLRWSGDTLVINAGPYADAKSGMALWGEVPALAKETSKAKHVIVDVRYHPQNAEERDLAAFVISQLRGLTAEPVVAPASQYVHHSGYRPQQGGTSGGYFSGLLTVPGETFGAAADGTAPARVVFVTDAESTLPAIAVALQRPEKRSSCRTPRWTRTPWRTPNPSIWADSGAR